MHIPPPFYFASAFIAGMALDRWVPLPRLDAQWTTVRLAGSYGLMAAAMMAGGWAILRFLRHHTPVIPGRTARAMVTDGPNRVTRNPMYVGLFVLYGALSLRTNLLWPLLLAPLLWLLLNYRIVPGEERHLTERFGAAYVEYCQHVRRWL